jgi:hypothetical protein
MSGLKDILVIIILGIAGIVGIRIAAFLKRLGDNTPSGKEYTSGTRKYDSAVAGSARSASASAQESGILSALDGNAQRNTQEASRGLGEAGRSLEAARQGLTNAAIRLEELISENSRI